MTSSGQQVRSPASAATLRILTLLARERGALSAAEIAERLSIPRSSTYDLLHTMEHLGYLVHYQRQQSYGLGSAAYELGSGYLRSEPLAQVGQPLLDTLVRRTHASAHLGTLHGTDVLYLVEQRAPHHPSLVTDTGVRLPALGTASGRAMLAYLPPAQVKALFPRPASEPRLRPHAKGPLVTPLAHELRRTRQRGYAIEHNEVTPGFSSVALPVFDQNSWPVASVSLTFHAVDLDEELFHRYALEVRPFARALSGQLYPIQPTRS